MWSDIFIVEGVVDGVKPVLILPIGLTIYPNLGILPFKYPPKHEELGLFQFWKSLHDRSFEFDDKSNVLNWGYEFSVEPTTELVLNITREFDLIWKKPEGVEGIQDIYIWRYTYNYFLLYLI